MRIGQATAELTARLAALDNEGGAVREKVQLLEDAHTLQDVRQLNPFILSILPIATFHPYLGLNYFIFLG